MGKRGLWSADDCLLGLLLVGGSLRRLTLDRVRKSVKNFTFAPAFGEPFMIAALTKLCSLLIIGCKYYVEEGCVLRRRNGRPYNRPPAIRSFIVSLTCRIILFLPYTLCLTSSALAETGPLKPFEYSLPRMGTVFRIVLYAANSTIASEASSEAFDRVEQLEQIFSDYREDSELMRVCRTASQSPQRLSSDLYMILQSSLRFSALSDGAFDVTIGPIVRLWREARSQQRLPEAERLSKARLAVGYHNLVLDPDDHTLFLKRDDMSLDLGAIAKGYAADQARAVLEKYGIRKALVAAGGDLSIGDPPPATEGWEVQIRSWTSGSIADSGMLQLHNCNVSTSGDKFQFLEAKGTRYSHIIDPQTGLGITDSVSTTVIAPDGATADALATTLSILPVKRALALADLQDQVAAFLVRRQGKQFVEFRSRRFPPVAREARFRTALEVPVLDLQISNR